MHQTLKLILPAIIPSWRFFDEIAPSPRIEYTLLKTQEEKPKHWQEFRPRAEHLTIFDMLKRLFWNPKWNETLFLVSCSERLMDQPTEHSQQEIFKRIAKGMCPKKFEKSYLQYRLLFISRNGTGLQKEITFISPLYHLETGAVE